ncbi:MAG: metal-dependent hydrolase with the TIM-barrel fold protein [Ruminococcaceae bacterium]|nr:metal-dependent hydrolase with the TIM-barrel fold protein [Oscillospiraceae bacterium]
MKVYEGSILTVNRTDEVCRYLVEDRGRIAYVGRELPAAYAREERVSLGERALIPAFADTHQHFASFSLFHAGLNVMDATSNDQILQMVDEFARRASGKSLIAFGASPYSVAERRLVSREELDRVTHGKPLFLVKYDGHACVVNTALLQKLPKKIQSLRGYHPDTGEMNQEAFFAVSDYITNTIPISELLRDMQGAADYEASRGIGMIHSVSGVGFALNADISMETWFARSAQSGMQIRVFPQSMDTRVATSRGLPRIGGCFACALDGCFGSQDAAMNAPYASDASNSGVLYYTDEQVTAFCKAANRLGLQIEMHAIGDRAFDQATRALKAALDDCPRDDHRHGIIHACLPTPEGVDICEKYHIQVPMQVAFDNWRQEPQEYTEKLLGSERNAALNPVRTFLERGCVVSFGSDAPCTSPDPIVWLDKAVNHSNPAQRVSIRDALRMATYNGYWATFDEKERGSLEKGKVADMAVLSANPYETPADRLGTLRVEKTILGGKDYAGQRQGISAAVLRGMLSRARA